MFPLNPRNYTPYNKIVKHRCNHIPRPVKNTVGQTVGRTDGQTDGESYPRYVKLNQNGMRNGAHKFPKSLGIFLVFNPDFL